MIKMKIKQTLITALWILLGIIYFPIYCAAYLLKMFAKLLLSISYYGVLNKRMGTAVLKSIFNWYETKV